MAAIDHAAPDVVMGRVDHLLLRRCIIFAHNRKRLPSQCHRGSVKQSDNGIDPQTWQPAPAPCARRASRSRGTVTRVNSTAVADRHEFVNLVGGIIGPAGRFVSMRSAAAMVWSRLKR